VSTNEVKKKTIYLPVAPGSTSKQAISAVYKFNQILSEKNALGKKENDFNSVVIALMQELCEEL